MRWFHLIGFLVLALQAFAVSAGVIRYTDGARYEGGVENGNRQGEGTFYFANGDTLSATQWEWRMDVPAGFMRVERKDGDIAFMHSQKRWFEVNYGLKKKMWDKRAMMFYKVLRVPKDNMVDVIGMVSEKGYGTAEVDEVLFMNPGPRTMQLYRNECGMNTVWQNPRSGKTEPLLLGAECDAQGLPHGAGIFRSTDGLLGIEVNFEHGALAGEAEMKLLKVEDYERLQEGRTRLVSLTWARGRPEFVLDQGQKYLELRNLSVHQESAAQRRWSFYNGETRNLQPYGKGYCYEDVWRFKSDGWPVHEVADTYVKGQAQACEFGKANGEYAYRTDELYRNRIRMAAAALDARFARQAEELREVAEHNRREEERRAAEDRADAARRPVPYVPSAVAGAARLQQIQRDAEAYGASRAPGRSAPTPPMSSSAASGRNEGSVGSASASGAGSSAADSSSRQASAASPTPATQGRNACRFDDKIFGYNYSESVARAYVQKRLDETRAMRANKVGDPVRFVSDSGISCEIQRNGATPNYRCGVATTIEVMSPGPCSTSSGAATGVMR
ncbi:MORN repeat-containing protein [Polaromonas sp.]|uniref:MORN repeat-containing protein n=1 Tax=Polaromonas sp. TaxID=1869339 RepID=UPI002488BDA7|nr:MORN repeat-containing protein [Polaromonas sp.]MDI1272033.1 MORN repeat-containing protein [Polaromonas sp.]